MLGRRSEPSGFLYVSAHRSSVGWRPGAWTRRSRSPGTSRGMGASSYFRNSGPPRLWIRTAFMVDGMRADCIAPVCIDTSVCKPGTIGCDPMSIRSIDLESVHASRCDCETCVCGDNSGLLAGDSASGTENRVPLRGIESKSYWAGEKMAVYLA